MTAAREIRALREALSRLERKVAAERLVRDELREAEPPWWERLGHAARRGLARAGLGRLVVRPFAWSGALKHGPATGGGVLLLWAEGLERDTQRTACLSVSTRLAKEAGGVPSPVLVTDVPDFGFYSRLGWLIEYLPSLVSAPAYRETKRQYLAWRYRDALAAPLGAAAAAADAEWEALLGRPAASDGRPGPGSRAAP